MTAVDAAVQARLLGAENVTIVYRRGQDRMCASRHEQEHATASGVRIICNAAPVALHGNGTVAEVEFAYTEDGRGRACITDQRFRLRADQVFRAIGQRLDGVARGAGAEGRQDRRGRGGPHHARRSLGRRRLRGGRRRPDRHRRRRGPRRGRGHPPMAGSGGRDIAPRRHRGLRERTWQTFAATSSASSPRTPSGWPRPRPRTRNTTSAAPIEAGWGGVVWKTLGSEGPPGRQRQRPALRRDPRRRPARPGHQQHRADHRPPAGGEPARDQVGQARLPRPRADHQPDGALRRGKLEVDPGTHRGYRRRRGGAELRLPARHGRTRHGQRRRPGAGVYRDGHAVGEEALRACPAS